MFFYFKKKLQSNNGFRNFSENSSSHFTHFSSSCFDSRDQNLFKGNEDKKYSNKLMQLRVLLQFIAIIVLVGLAYFFKN